MCHHRTDWSRIANSIGDSEDEPEREDDRDLEREPEVVTEQDVGDEREEEPVPADD
jgi:hypothetical protein